MQPRILTPTLLVGLLALTGCEPKPAPFTDAQKAAVTQEILQAQKQLFALAEKMAPYDPKWIWEGPDFLFLMPDGKAMKLDEFKKLWAEFETQLTGQKFTIRMEKVLVLGPDKAIYVWQGADDLFMKDGSIQKQDSYNGAYLYEKRNNEWRCSFMSEAGLPPVVVKPEPAKK